MLHSHLLQKTLHFTQGERVLLLNSALDPIIAEASRQGCELLLAEDNSAAVQQARQLSSQELRHLAFHDYILHAPRGDMDIAIMNLLYQPGNTWMFHGIQLAHYALHPGGRFYVVGAKDRGVLTVARRMQERFGNLETLEISKGQRVVCSQRRQTMRPEAEEQQVSGGLEIFAESKLDEGTKLLLGALEVRERDVALDLGCGAGFIGLHIARLAPQGNVTMVDVSLAAIAATQQAVQRSGLHNIRVLPSNGIQALRDQRFDLVATNPPFHQGGIQTSEIAERFIRETASILQPEGRFYLVANRFLKYEPILQAHFRQVSEVAGNSRYKVLRALRPAGIGG